MNLQAATLWDIDSWQESSRRGRKLLKLWFFTTSSFSSASQQGTHPGSSPSPGGRYTSAAQNLRGLPKLSPQKKESTLGSTPTFFHWALGVTFPTFRPEELSLGNTSFYGGNSCGEASSVSQALAYYVVFDRHYLAGVCFCNIVRFRA